LGVVVRLGKSLFLLLGVLLLAVSGFPQTAGDIEQKERELRDIRQKLAHSREKAKELEDKEATILERLQGLDVQIELTENLAEELKSKEKRKSGEITEVEAKIVATGEKLRERQKILGKRLKAIYKHGALHPLEVILSAGSFPDMVTRAKYLTLIAEQDARLKNQIERHRRELVDYGAKLERDLLVLKDTRMEKEEELTNLDEDKGKREELLDNTRKEKKKQESLARELERAERQLQSLIDDLIRKRAEKAKEAGEPPLPQDWDFAKLRGRLDWPVRGKVVSSYGAQKHPKYGTQTLNNGMDIEAPMGANVYAVASGQVVYADRFLGYGQVVILDHGGGYYTLYAHLSAILTDVPALVNMGDVIGQVGESGSLEGPRLHFEIREQGRPSDPSGWLKD
jgi:septal ring factor EnvC (AmiA/AmiB activator)